VRRKQTVSMPSKIREQPRCHSLISLQSLSLVSSISVLSTSSCTVSKSVAAFPSIVKVDAHSMSLSTEITVIPCEFASVTLKLLFLLAEGKFPIVQELLISSTTVSLSTTTVSLIVLRIGSSTIK
jgi:hypothetical protein